MRPHPIPTFSEPMEVTVEEGEIVVLGPNGVNGSFTPDAAEESARRLLAAVAGCRGGGAAA